MDNTKIKISIESQLLYLPMLRKIIRGICSSFIEDEKILQEIELSINEALSNVIYHAYQNEPGHEIQILVTLFPKEGIFEIIDLGLKNPDLETHLPLNIDKDVKDIENLAESGRGLFFIHQLMDEVTYKNENGKNILTLRKRFEAKS